jgi:hypothetical protein
MALGIPHATLCLVPVRILGLGHDQQSEEQIQTAGAWSAAPEENVPPTSLADGKEPEVHQDKMWRFNPSGWVV